MRKLLALTVWLAFATGLMAFDTRNTPDCADGTKVQLVLPANQHMKNVGGSDGAGLCVYTSVTLAAKWQNVTEAYGLRKFAEGRPGGSYPEKLDADLKLYAQRQNVTLPNYLQHTGGDDALLDLLIATRRMPGITYAGKDDFYDSPILHMVNLVHLDATHGAIQDNNRPGKWTSDTRQKILYRWKGLDDNGKDLLVPARQGLRTVWVPAGGGWAFAWLNAPPPPRPQGNKENTGPSDPVHRCGHWERTVIDDFPVWTYWCNGDLIGGFCGDKWYALTVEHVEQDGRIVSIYAFGPEGDAPTGLSPPQAEPTDDWNKGVDSWKFDRRNRYWINGVECSQAKAYAIASDPSGLVDDSDKYHLSIIGTEADKARIVGLFKTSLSDYARRVHVQVYAKDAWPVEYLASAVTLQEPAKLGGRVAAVGTDNTEASIKKVLTLFDAPPPVKPQPVPPPQPAPAPEPKPAPSPQPEPAPKSGFPNWVLLLGGALAILLFRKKA